ncbi:MAG TPA: hypothetical protein VFN49_11925 [Candidatus Aquilonibacter sp.]|nr:hypothetical protein [Candidatus Aquilonibacter sp.]
MIAEHRARYNERVGSSWLRGAPGFLLVFAFVALGCARANADTQSIATTSAPVIFGQLQYGRITIHTANRQDVQIRTDGNVRVRHIERVPPVLPFQPTFLAQTVQTPDGPLLQPPEPFMLAPLDPSVAHDAVIFNGTGNVEVTIPAGSPLVIARVGRGKITIDGYHGGTLFTTVRVGTLRIKNVSGTGGFQINNGPAIVQNGNFDRLRARTGRGNMFFENTNVRQIDATSLTGSIVYDNGSFEPGLARFESQRGNIALGIRGGAQVDAHSGSGRVISEGSFRSGPVVTATSGSGAIFTYTGSIRQHPKLMRQLPMRPHRRKPPH